MSSRIQKQKKSQSARRRKDKLLKTFSSSHSIPIPSYTNCIRRSYRTYIASSKDSLQYEEYIRSNRSGCNMLSTTDAQFQTIAVQYAKLEREVADAVTEAVATMARF